MPTPVWFVKDEGVLYVRTVANSGKVKRIRNNSHVRVMPCGVRGEPMGEWVDGEASLVDEATAKHVSKLMGRKYGLQKLMFELMGKFQGRSYTVIAVRV